jgi:hypothetical protein
MAEAHEWELGGVSRDTLLARLLGEGWTPCGPTDDWDVEKNGVRLALATERGELGWVNTLVRLAGDDAGLPGWLRPNDISTQ